MAGTRQRLGDVSDTQLAAADILDHLKQGRLPTSNQRGSWLKDRTTLTISRPCIDKNSSF
jgi:hypothetical protein